MNPAAQRRKRRLITPGSGGSELKQARRSSGSGTALSASRAEAVWGAVALLLRARCQPGCMPPSGAAAGGVGLGAERYLRAARSAPASSTGAGGPAWGRCSAETRPLPTAPAPLWRPRLTWHGWSLWGRGGGSRRRRQRRKDTEPANPARPAAPTQTRDQDAHASLPRGCLSSEGHTPCDRWGLASEFLSLALAPVLGVSCPLSHSRAYAAERLSRSLEWAEKGDAAEARC